MMIETSICAVAGSRIVATIALSALVGWGLAAVFGAKSDKDINNLRIKKRKERQR